MLNMTPAPLITSPAASNGNRILIWAGSSIQGALAISHGKHAGYTVVSTCSAHNMPLLRSQGADHVFDRSDKEGAVRGIKASGTIDCLFDPISKVEPLHMIAEILSDADGELLQEADVVTLLPPSMITGLALSEGITVKFLRLSNRAEENKEFVKWYRERIGYLESGLKGGWIRGVPGVVTGGLEKVEEGVNMLEKGVSGRRVVIEPWRN